MSITRRSLLGTTVVAAGLAPAVAEPPVSEPAVAAVSAVASPSVGCSERFSQRAHMRYVRQVYRRARVRRRAHLRVRRIERCSLSARARRNMRRFRLRQSRARERRQIVGSLAGVLASIAACESGGDPNAVSAGGLYTGLHQFDDRTWASVGGTGRAKDAPASEQTMRAAILYRRRGAQPWPICGR